MIGRRRSATRAADPWEDEGRRIAPLLDSSSAAVVVGNDPDAAARVALGIARVVSLERRVVIGDLAGASPTLAALAGHRDVPGITESFLQGVSLNDVACPASDGTASLFILPCGGHTAVPEEVLRSDRWRRLAAGFASAEALLLLVATAGTQGLAALVVQTDGAVSVGDAQIPLEWRVIAQAGELTSTAPRPSGARAPNPRWPVRRIILAGLLMIAVLAGMALLWPRRGGRGARTATPVASNRQPAHAPTRAPAAAPVVTPADTVNVSVPVNPLDSANAAEFAVELVATNTAAGANLWVGDRSAQLPGVTVTPVLLGNGRVRWHRVVAGAWRERQAADSMLRSLRAGDVLRAGAGLVIRVPLALLLDTDVPRGAAPARAAALVARGVPAYALLQDDGTVRLFAGAFESAAAAVPLGADLRAAGLAPQLAYRTGRTF